MTLIAHPTCEIFSPGRRGLIGRGLLGVRPAGHIVVGNGQRAAGAIVPPVRTRGSEDHRAEKFGFCGPRVHGGYAACWGKSPDGNTTSAALK